MGNNYKFFILDSNKISQENLKTFLEELNLNYEIKIYNDYTKGVEEVKSFGENAIVFADISEKNINILNKIKELKLFTSKIVITSTDYSTDTIINAMRMGAKEFLPKPILKNDLIRVVTLLHQQEAYEEASASKIIAIYSNKGGIGKTTIATNLAMELAKTTSDKVALIDLNLQLGDISTFLNLSPSFDVAYFINNLTDKKEEAFLKSFEKYEDSELYILSDPKYIEQSEAITPYQIDNLFTALRKVFPYIIIDMSSNIDPVSLKILDKSDFVFFTTIVNMPAIRNAQRCLNLFNSRRYPADKVKIIINRYMENDTIKIFDIESTLGEKIYWKIPNNYFSIMEAINKGVPVSKVNSDSNIADNFRELANKISDEVIEKTILKYRGV